MKRIIAVLILGCLVSPIKSQINLIPDPGFEDTLCCPGIPPNMGCSKFWYDPTGMSSDLYNTCNLPSLGWYSDYYGPLDTFNEDGIAGLYLYITGFDISEYVSTQLTQTLDSNHLYCLSFYIRPNNGTIFVDGLGVYFSTQPVDSAVDILDYLTPQYQNPTGNILKDTLAWSEITFNYLASGGEKFITIGNFKLGSETQWQAIGSGTGAQSYMFMDNVSLFDCTDTSSVVETLSLNFEIYPNPANEHLTIQCPDSNVTLYIFDVLGQNVKQVSTSQGKNEVSVSHLAAGVYLVRYKDLVKKIIIER